MVPGGTNEVVKTENLKPHEALNLVLTRVVEHWPDAVFEDGKTGLPYANLYEVPPRDVSEILVHKDRQAMDDVRANGVTEENGDKLLHIVVDEGSVTLVHTNQEKLITELAELLKLGISF